MRGVNRYLVCWKGFTKELVDEFEGRLSAEVRRQEKVETGRKIKENLRTGEYGRSKLPGKYMAKLLYGWDNRRFEEEYLRKLEVSFFGGKTLKGG